MGGFVMVQEWPGLLDVLAVLGWTRPIGRGVWGLWCNNVQLEKRQSRDGRDEAHGLLLLQAQVVFGGEVIMGCGAKRRAGRR
jgi:hypothetical protein